MTDWTAFDRRLTARRRAIVERFVEFLRLESVSQEPEKVRATGEWLATKAPTLSLNARLQALRFRSNQDGEKWKNAVKEHEKMVEALDARDPAAMREVLRTHLNNKRDVVIEQLRGSAAPASGTAP